MSYLQTTLVLTVITLLLDRIAKFFFLYHQLGWFDIVVHCIGGAAVAYAIAFFINVVPFIARTNIHRIALILGGVFIVGVSWEIFEYVIGIAPFLNAGLNTVSDLLAALLGATGAAYSIGKKSILSDTQTHL